jgi:lauroyl/myristoyl acyltransferase
MKLSLFRQLHTTYSLRWLARSMPPRWCFIANFIGIALALALYPHASRSVRPLRLLLTERHGARIAGRRAREHLLFRRWQNHLEIGWKNWAWRLDDFVRIEGKEHLDQTLGKKSGVVLLSGHYYGIDRLVDPILAQMGYAVTRWANPVHRESIEERWGKGDFAKWHLVDFGGDSWHRARMVLNVRKHLKHNHIVHLSVRGQPRGESSFWVQNHYESFFLEPKGIVLLETLEAPVLPCFTIPDRQGNVVIKLYPPVLPSRELIMESFGSLYSRHLNEFPEYSRVWRRLVRGEAWW